MIVSLCDYENKYINNGSEIMILNAPRVTTSLLQDIKKTKRVFILENKLYEYFDSQGIAAFINAIDSFDFKLFHFCYGVIDIKLSEEAQYHLQILNSESKTGTGELHPEEG